MLYSPKISLRKKEASSLTWTWRFSKIPLCVFRVSRVMCGLDRTPLTSYDVSKSNFFHKAAICKKQLRLDNWKRWCSICRASNFMGVFQPEGSSRLRPRGFLGDEHAHRCQVVVWAISAPSSEEAHGLSGSAGLPWGLKSCPFQSIDGPLYCPFCSLFVLIIDKSKLLPSTLICTLHKIVIKVNDLVAKL